MTDIRTLKQTVFSTPVDVRYLAMGSLPANTHADTLYLNDRMITLFLLRARGIISYELASVISGETVFEVTPYVGPSLIPLPDEENLGENSGSGVLWGLTPATTAYTEYWTITFTSSTAFTVTGSYSGSQGTGTTSTAFTSTNSDIVIPSDAWSGTPATGDKFYIPVYKHHPSIVTIATMLATGLIFKGQATGSAPDTNPAGSQLYNDAIKALKAMKEAGGAILGVNTLISSSDLMVSYEIAPWGADLSNYQTDENQRLISNTSSYDLPWWRTW